MLVIFLLAALGSSIPAADINKICASAQVDALPEDRAKALRSCVGDETSARDQIKREWNRFTAADRSNCASDAWDEIQLCGIADVSGDATRRQLRPLAGRFTVAAAEAAFAA
jgi:hypothetical protein